MPPPPVATVAQERFAVGVAIAIARANALEGWTASRGEGRRNAGILGERLDFVAGTRKVHLDRWEMPSGVFEYELHGTEDGATLAHSSTLSAPPGADLTRDDIREVMQPAWDAAAEIAPAAPGVEGASGPSA